MKALLTVSCVGAAVLATACHRSSSSPPPTPPVQPRPVVNLGDPRDDLTADELAAFERGRALFSKRFKPSEGLGPRYNATSCSSCHSRPVPGGGSDLYRNFYVASFGTFPQFFNLPGLISPIVPAFGGGATFSLEEGRIVIPDMVGTFPVQSEQRNGIPMFGTGLFELIKDTTIFANADPDDLDGDGISGRFNTDGAGTGRFGTKAQSNNVELFVRAPLFNQMGISSDPFLGPAGTASLGHGAAIQGSSTPNARTIDFDGVADPEIAPADLGDLIAFTRFLAPPQKQEFNEAAKRGDAQFVSLGCTNCHIPSLESTKGPVEAYTDLLIHDMGPDLAGEVSFGTPQASSIASVTTEAEWRTAPLWGVSKMAPFLHDGRASTMDEAIRFHGGEALTARDAYVALDPEQREDLLEFLRHL